MLTLNLYVYTHIKKKASAIICPTARFSLTSNLELFFYKNGCFMVKDTTVKVYFCQCSLFFLLKTKHFQAFWSLFLRSINQNSHLKFSLLAILQSLMHLFCALHWIWKEMKSFFFVCAHSIMHISEMAPNCQEENSGFWVQISLKTLENDPSGTMLLLFFIYIYTFFTYIFLALSLLLLRAFCSCDSHRCS